MAIALTLGDREVILKADLALPVEQRTVFIIRTLSARENADIDDMVQVLPNGKAHMPIGQKVLSTLRIGLKGWRNFRDGSGKEVPFAPPEQGMCAWENIDRLANEQRYELCNLIEGANSLSEDERKNSA